MGGHGFGVMQNLMWHSFLYLHINKRKKENPINAIRRLEVFKFTETSERKLVKAIKSESKYNSLLSMDKQCLRFGSSSACMIGRII